MNMESFVDITERISRTEDFDKVKEIFSSTECFCVVNTDDVESREISLKSALKCWKELFNELINGTCSSLCLQHLCRFLSHEDIKFQALLAIQSLLVPGFVLPAEVHCDALSFIPDNVMVNLPDPILVTDFFFNSYHLGDPFNILALNGLYVLIVKYNLDYPDFYRELYGLLQPSIFYLKNRDQFFTLLDLFLSSLHVPSYLVAAFVKRLARLTLIAPPDCLLIILTLIKNWLIRHTGLECLVNRQSPTNVIEDPYRAEESNPLQSNAIDSSLWEIKSLTLHYLPEVAKRAQFIDRSLERVEDPLIQKSTDKIFLKNFNKPVKDTSLTFVPPNSLFQSKLFDFRSCFSY